MNIFLTGSTGFLGSSIINELLSENYNITALVRNKDNAKKIINNKIKLVEGDLTDNNTYKKYLKEITTIIHAGACYSEYYSKNDKNLLVDSNVSGTRQLLDAAKEHGVNNIVYISSAAVLQAKNNGIVDEQSPYSTSNDLYFQSKVSAEKEVYNFINNNKKIRVIILLPTVMLGPYDRKPTPTGTFILKYLKGMYKFIIPGSNRIIDVRDVAKVSVMAIKLGKSGEKYILGGNQYTFEKIFTTLAEVTNTTALKNKISFRKLLIMSNIISIIGKITGKTTELKPHLVKRMQKNYSYDSSKAKKVFNYTTTTLDKTLKDTVQWFEKQNYI